MEDVQKVNKELNVLASPRIVAGLMERNLVEEDEEEEDVIKRPPRVWTPLSPKLGSWRLLDPKSESLRLLDPKKERILSTVLFKKRLQEC